MSSPNFNPADRTDWLDGFFGRVHRLLSSQALAIGVSLAIVAIGLVDQLNTMVIPDIGWYLHSAERYLDGGTLYRDIFIEVNPPLGFFLTLPAVVIARIAGFPPTEIFAIYVYAILAVSLAAVWRLLNADRSLSNEQRNGLILLIATVYVIGPGNQLGQREHFMILLSLPYLVAYAMHSTGQTVPRSALFLIGVAAGTGLALKPHYLLVPVALEVYRVARGGRLLDIPRALYLGIAFSLIVYGVILVTVTPDYLTHILPYALEVYNVAYRNPLWINLLRFETITLPLGTILHIATRPRQRAPWIGDIFFIASACLFVAYVVQMKGWDYHLYPASSCLVLAYGALFFECLEVKSAKWAAASKPAIRRGIAAWSLGLIILLSVLDALRLGYKSPFTEIMTPYVDRYAPNGAIAIFGSNVWPGFPLVNYKDVRWSSRFPTLWLLPGTIRNQDARAPESGSIGAEMLAFTRDSVVSDFMADMPDLVVVDNRTEKSYFGGLPFDYLEFFQEDERFAHIWSEYVWVGEVVEFAVYRRNCAPHCDKVSQLNTRPMD
jgi:hypothetical protein